MAFFEPLPMSQKKDHLVKYLGMGPDTYTMMASETDRVYKWLTSEKRHRKGNCKRKPPYDWSDFLENSKDEAMRRIANSGDAHTSYYWKLADDVDGCPNWIARWFLYHKFRYRDGRNRNPIEKEERRQTHSSSSKHSHRHHKHRDYATESNEYDEYETSYDRNSEMNDYDPQGYGYAATGSCASSHCIILDPTSSPGFMLTIEASASTSSDYGIVYSAQNPYPNASSVGITYEQNGQYDELVKDGDRTMYWDPVRDSVKRR